MDRRPMTFKPPLAPEHHGEAIVQLQICTEELDTRLTEFEELRETIVRWGERALWLTAMVALLLINLGREQTAETIIHVLKLLAG